MVGFRVIKDLVENSVVQVKRVPTTHVLADILTKEMSITDVFPSSLKDGKHTLHQTVQEAEKEEHRKHLRQPQRHRQKKREHFCHLASRLFLPR